MATYAIGDIQGCYNELRQLLDQLQFNTDRDQLWFTGDLVNRGPDSLDTLKYIKALGDNAITVLGNHDLHLLATAYDHRRPGRRDTLDAILDSPQCDDLMQWLRHQPLIHHDSSLNITMLHAGIHPDWSIDTARRLADEVEQVLQDDEQYPGYFQHMYGDKPPIWSEQLNGWSRLRFITNILTRLRFFNDEGKPVLSAKGSPDANRQLTPWFDIPDRVTQDDRIIFGHWSTLALTDRRYHNVYPIDSGCLWGGKLTALRIDDGSLERFDLDCDQQAKP